MNGGSDHDARLVPAAAGAWLVTAVGIVAPVELSATVAGLLLVGGVAGGWWWRRRGPAGWVVPATAAAVVIGGFAATITLRQFHVQRHVLYGAAGERPVVVTVRDDPRSVGGGGSRVWLPVRVGGLIGGVDAVVFAPARGWADVMPGQRLRAEVTVRPPTRGLTVATLTARGEPRQVRAPPWYQRLATHVRSEFRKVAAMALPSPQSGLLPGLVLGDVSAQDPQLVNDFRATSLSHLTAVSGSNFTLIAGSVLWLVRSCGARPRVAAAVTACVIVGFVILVRPSPSVVRAAVMGAVGLIAIASSRRSAAIPALATAILVLLTVSPALAVDPGFALSVAATAGLIVFGSLVRDRLSEWGVARPLAELLAVAAVAQVVTAPLVALYSGTVSAVGMVANIAVALTIPPITILGTAAAVMSPIVPLIADLLVRFTGPAVWWLVQVAQRLARVPGATVRVPDGAAGALLVTAAILAVAASVWALRRARQHPAHGRRYGGVGRRGVWHDGRHGDTVQGSSDRR
ncbi:ComEC/Rec2 family competence protein [Jongsikchunia kroppenstedtii]|uniref:ComEC/Rec2 family competence protein n=1 Tax=Jongsikchunia kroppenstedtii TaxID=1121721 RepID=UPI00036C9C1D|nr:ComEC/Rec2 family competence protein [Jongsikchunia kroppenstedtii]